MGITEPLSELWTTTTIGEIAEVYDGPHATPKKTSTGPVFLGISSLSRGRLDYNDLEYLSEEDFLKWTRRVTPRAGDIVFSYETRLGEAAIIPENFRCCLGRRLGLLRVKVEGVDSRFLLYAYLGPQFQATISERTVHGSTVDRIPIIDLPKFPISIPPLFEQQAIAHILGTLDDKIELNRRMNKTLESIARAIFKSWFIDFEPIPGLGPHKEWEDSVLGKIPKGWSVGTLCQEFNIIMGQSPPGTTYNEDGQGMPFFQGRRDFGFRYPSNRVYCTAPTRFAEAGDTLVSVRAPVGDINMADSGCCIGRGLAAVRHRGGSRSYTHYYLKAMKETFDRFEAEGTVFGSITKTDFEKISCPAPPDEVVQKFENMLQPVDQQIENNERQSATLTSIRDALLPKLLSGEIRIKDAGKIVSQAV